MSHSERPKERRARETLQPYLHDGETLLAFTSTDEVVGPRKPVVGLTPERIIVITSTPGDPSKGVFGVDRRNVAQVTWSGLWARLNIYTRSPHHRIEQRIYGDLWKRRAATLANETPVVVAPPPSGTDQRYDRRVLDIGELDLTGVDPGVFLEKARQSEEQGLIESAEALYLQRLRDLHALGNLKAACLSLDTAMQNDERLAANPEAVSLHDELQGAFSSRQTAGGFLLGNVGITLFSTLFYAILSGLQAAEGFIATERGGLLFYDVLLGIALWKGSSRARTWAILRAVAGVALFGLGNLSFFDLLAELTLLERVAQIALGVAIFFALRSNRKRDTSIATGIYLVGFLGATVAWGTCQLMTLLGAG